MTASTLKKNGAGGWGWKKLRSFQRNGIYSGLTSILCELDEYKAKRTTNSKSQFQLEDSMA